MKAYIKTHYEGGRGFFCCVVSEQDYHERGPHSHSHRTQISTQETAVQAQAWALSWAEKNGYTITSLAGVAAASHAAG